jgi:Zn-dependent protease with chaperone function
MRLPKTEFNILLFGPGIQAAGLTGQSYFEDGVLVLHAAGHWYTAPVSHIRLELGGFDGRQWMITWQSPVGAFTAILQGEAAVAKFIAQAPASVAKHLQRIRRKHTRVVWDFRMTMMLIGVFLIMLLFSLVWFWLNADRFSRWAADRVSMAQEVKLGDMAFAQLQDKFRFLPEDAFADQVVDRIGVRLTAGSAYPFKFDVVKDDRVNAFALPGGHVVVFTGLLKAANNADEVAGVLAHEVSHVEKRHALRNMIHALGLRAVMAVALGDFAGSVWGGMADHLANLSFSRDLEREADLEGLHLLRQAGLPADGMVGFFAQMADQEKADIDLLSNHPTSDERLAELRAAMALQGPYVQKSLDIDWDTVKQSLDADRAYK